MNPDDTHKVLRLDYVLLLPVMALAFYIAFIPHVNYANFIIEKKVFTRIMEYPRPSDNEADAFLKAGCSDTAFLKDNGISIVYTRGSCDNPALTPVREGVYLLK